MLSKPSDRLRHAAQFTTKVVTETPPGEIATLMASSPADPFQIDHDCLNPSGHHFVADCSEVVCLHCARIAWR